jgi:hypothetical protein
LIGNGKVSQRLVVRSTLPEIAAREWPKATCGSQKPRLDWDASISALIFAVVMCESYPKEVKEWVSDAESGVAAHGRGHLVNFDALETRHAFQPDLDLRDLGFGAKLFRWRGHVHADAV